jgi:DUF2946 family protein
MRAKSYLAILAIALHALWPLIAQAKPKNAVLAVPVCTVDGVTHYLELPMPLEEQSAKRFDHCALCALGADRVGVAPQFAEVELAAELSEARRLPALAAAFTEKPDPSSAKPRAPPSAS